VVLVSASPELYLVPLAEGLGVRALLCTRLEVDDGGRLTGRIAGVNCAGGEKVRRLQEHLAGRPARVWAYGNSADDGPLLAFAHHAFLVTRRRGRTTVRSLPTSSPVAPRDDTVRAPP
jgi:phosphatidylglycerophosphatase C